MRLIRWLVAAVVFLLMSEWAFAGRFLDDIRDYNLNDYAIGIGFSVEQNPYLGAKNSAYSYPYLTSFHHSSLSNDWLLIRDGELGVRLVSDNGWELGVIGRVQTLGLGVLETDDLLGISDRKWALEAGPTIGWRGWPVHLNWTTYLELTNRHDGLISQLAFLLPMEFTRGYFVPSIEFIYESDDYTDYYYSVTPAEATAMRPAYHPGASTSTTIKLRWGYALNDQWLLTAKVGLKKLGTEITASPIIDHDRTWSAGLALAYNANVFQPREYDGPPPRSPQFDLRIGRFRDMIDTKIVRDTSDGIPGFETDIEDILGVSDQTTVLQIDATVRVGHYHRLEFGYFRLGRDSTTILDNDLDFGDEMFQAGTELDTRVNARIFRFGYAYSLIRNAQFEFAVMAGIHLIDLETDITADSTNQKVHSNAGTPLPVIGVQASIFLGEKTTLGAKLQLFRTDFDSYEGSLNFGSLDIQHQLGKNVSVGLGYNFYGIKLTSRDSDLNGHIDVRHHGPVAFFTVGF